MAEHALLQKLRKEIGTLRIMFHELGHKTMSPSRSVIFSEISERWNLADDEKAALDRILRRCEPSGGRDVVEFHVLQKLLRKGALLGNTQVHESPRSRIAVRSVEREFDSALAESASSNGQRLTLPQFVGAVRPFGVDAVEAHERFLQAKQGAQSKTVDVASLIATTKPHLAAVRQKNFSSEQVHEALSWKLSMPLNLPQPPETSKFSPRAPPKAIGTARLPNGTDTAPALMSSKWSPARVKSESPRVRRPHLPA
jgi:hypothetical protein